MANNDGFSVVEIMTCVAVISVMAIFAYPDISRWQHNLKLNDEVSGAVGNLQRAKMEAINYNAPVAIVFTSGSYQIFVDDGRGTGGINGDYTKQIDEIMLVDHTLPAGISFESASFGALGWKVRFKGSIGNSSGSAVLKGEKGKVKIKISSAGRIRTEKIAST